MSKRLIAVALLLFAAACTSPVQLIEPPKRVVINKTYSVAPTVAWTSYSTVSDVTWTIDGPGLQSLVFVDGVKDGAPLFAGRQVKNMPTYRKGMTPIEIKDLFVSTLGRFNYHQVKVRKMRPSIVGGVRGFRFEFGGTTKGGLSKQGFAVGAVRDDMLYLVYYWGAELHYYDKHHRDAERIVASLQFVKG